MTRFNSIVTKILTDNTSGASELAEQAIQAIKVFAENLSGENASKAIRTLDSAFSNISNLRPAMASIENWCKMFVVLFQKEIKKGTSYKRAAHVAQKQIITLRGEIEVKLLENMDRGLGKFNSFLTLSWSSAIGKFLIKKTGKKIKIFIMESRPLGEGQKLAKLLNDKKINVRLITDVSAFIALNHADVVLIGADMISKDLHVINKVGSCILALAAKEKRIPFFVVTDTMKMNPLKKIKDITKGSHYMEERMKKNVWKEHPELAFSPIFEVVPPHMITKFITEKGIFNYNTFRTFTKHNN